MSTSQQDINAQIVAAVRARAGLPPTTDDQQTPAAGATPTTVAAATPAPAAPGKQTTPSLWDSVSDIATGKGTSKMQDYMVQAARDIPGAVENGVAGAVNEVTNTAAHAADWIGEKAGIDPRFVKWYGDEHQKVNLIPGKLMANEPKTGFGETLETATQLGVGLVGVGKFFKAAEGIEMVGGAVEALNAATKGSKVAQAGVGALEGAAKTALADPLVMDAYKNRLSNLMENVPWVGDAMKKYFAADPKDPLAEAKMKQGLEGFVTGVPLEALSATASIIKNSRLFTDTAAKAADKAQAQSELSDLVMSLDKQINSAEKNARWQVADGVNEDGTFRVLDKKTGEIHPVDFKTRADAEGEAGMLNTIDIEKMKQNPPSKPFTPEQIEAYKQVAGDMTGQKFQDLLDNGGTDFNFHVVHGQEDAKKQLETLAQVERDAIDQARGGAEVSHAETIAIAKSISDDPDGLVARLQNTYSNTKDLAAHLLAGKNLMFLQGKRVSQLSQLADQAGESALPMARLGDALEQFFTTVSQVKSIQTNSARAVEIGKVDATSLGENALKPGATDQATTTLEREVAASGPQSVAARKILAALHGMSYDDMRTMARRVAVAGNDPSAILAAVRTTNSTPQVRTLFGHQDWANNVDKFNSYYVNSLISGSKTGAVIAASQTMNGLLRPIEYFNAGRPTFTHLFTQNRDYNPALMQQGANLLIGNFSNAWDSLKMAGKAFKVGSQILDGGVSPGLNDSIQGDFGTLVNLPSRVHMTAGEFFKQLAYRNNVRAAALKDFSNQTAETDVAKFVQNRMDAAFFNGQGIDKAGLNYARDLTFTTPLDPNSFGGKIQDITQQFPLAKLVAPFINISTNILNWGWERTPALRMLKQSVQADLQAGGERAAMAQSKLGTGQMLWGLAAAAALSGRITGRGPGDPKLRDQWITVGKNQPYSINVAAPGEAPNWVSYNRAEPVAIPFKLAADFTGIAADYVHGSGEIGPVDGSHLALAAITSLAQSMTSMTVLSGVVEALSAFVGNSPTEMDNYFKNEVKSLVPNFLNQNDGDPAMRETRTYMDAILDRIPGLSSKLPPRFNRLGEAVMKPPGQLNQSLNPWTVSPGSNGKLETSLMALNKAMPMPSPTEQGVRLDNDQFGRTKDGLTPYDRMMQLIGQPKSGPSLRKELDTITSSPGWKAMPNDAPEKYDMVAQSAERHRREAFDQVRLEFPALSKAITQAQNGNAIKKYLGDAGIQKILNLTK